MRDPERLSTAISELISRRGLAAPRGTAELARAWKEVAREPVAGNSRLLYLKDGTVHIAVSNSSLLNELVSFQSAALLTGLQAQCPNVKIRDLRFHLKSSLQSS